MSGLSGFHIGQTARLTKTFAKEDVATFSELVGDHNDIHLDEEYAATTRFGRCIVHGTLYIGLLGAILGTRLPGPGTVLVSQRHKFLKPVYVGDSVTATVEVTGILPERRRLFLVLSCENQDGIEVLHGEAETMLL